MKKIAFSKATPAADSVLGNGRESETMISFNDVHQILFCKKEKRSAFTRTPLLLFQKIYPYKDLNISKTEDNTLDCLLLFLLKSTGVHQTNIDLLQIHISGTINIINKRSLAKERI